MIDQAERLRELEIENETLLARIDTLHRVEKDNEVLRTLMENVEGIMNDKYRSFRVVQIELMTTRVKLQVLEESK